MSFYLKDGENLWPTAAGAYDVRSNLPVGTYVVNVHPQRGFFLTPIDDFKVSSKLYGKISSNAERILSTFADRPATTGVLLNGEKGSGKTMLAKLISQRAAESGIPTLVINTPFTGDGFNSFIQSIDEPCIIIFDEFEKVFNDEQQASTLTLLDGVYPTKKLFILTVNDKYRVNQHLKNRPGRIFYMLDFKGLDIEFIKEYCEDTLDDKVHIPQICRLTTLFESFNFDMLKALVEEMNRYKESPIQALEMLNAKPQDRESIRHNVDIIVNGKKVEKGNIHPMVVTGNPITHERLEFWIDSVVDDNDNIVTDSMEITLGQADLKAIDPEEGKYTYVFNEGAPDMAAVVITREKQLRPQYSWLDAI